MPALDQNTALMLLKGLTGTSAYVATVTPLKCRLTMNAPTAAVAGAEISGPGYTAGGQTVTFGNLTVTPTGAQCSNTTTLAWTNNGSAAWTIVGLELWDSSGTPVRKGYGLWDGQPVLIGPGSPFDVAVAALTWQFP
jgi:hypothetical protein